MLTEVEWGEVEPLLSMRIERIKEYREVHGAGLTEALKAVRDEACEKYFELTGFRESNPDALWHHRLSIYGPECESCGELLRTSEASYCANCGALAN
ncbi:hypothetical protein N9230_04940 [Akkermansiaceae bacterium]|nr:hypothetical protein [Akkermansiaceae bacterium]